MPDNPYVKQELERVARTQTINWQNNKTNKLSPLCQWSPKTSNIPPPAPPGMWLVDYRDVLIPKSSDMCCIAYLAKFPWTPALLLSHKFPPPNTSTHTSPMHRFSFDPLNLPKIKITLE